jgi:membrane protein DedA with SNARE-associated domain
MLNVLMGSVFDPHFIAQNSYIAVFVLVFLEALAIPFFPGEITLVTAGIYASQNHGTSPYVIVLAAIVGGFLGSLGGYFIGFYGGFKLAVNRGKRIGLTYERLKVGHYAFAKMGIWIVILGRFVSLFRSLLGLLAGITRMPKIRFLIANLVGIVAWSSLYGFGSYTLGNSIKHYSTIFTYVALPVVVVALIIGVILLKKNEKRLVLKAEQAYPGPIEHLI